MLKKNENRIYNILFISTYQSYYDRDHANFSRMHNFLLNFKENSNFNVIVLQPRSCKKNEIQSLKRNIETYYFRELRLLNINLLPFLDFNPFYYIKILKIIKKYRIDLIHIEYQFGLNCLRLLKCFYNVKISYNSYNVESIYAKTVGKYSDRIPRSLSRFYSIYNFLLEKLITKFVDNINVVSYSDKINFIKLYKVPSKTVLVCPFGYRKDVYNNPIKKNKAKEQFGIDPDCFVVLFHGSYYSNYANRESIHLIKQKIAPKIEDGQIIFLLAGNMPQYKNTHNIKFLGFVENLNTFIYSGDIAIAPILRGAGVKTKIIDYLSGNIPVITTKKGAEGLFLRDNIHGYIIEKPIEDTVTKILNLKKNPNKIIFFKDNIKKLIQDHYNWDKIVNNLKLRYMSIIET